VVDVLRGVEGISFVQFDDRDVVRHSLVQKIVAPTSAITKIGANRQLSLKLTIPPPNCRASRGKAPAA
jgi:phosphate starvation-inducible PhoH-like protein